MKSGFKGWGVVAEKLCTLASATELQLNDGQRWSLRRIGERLPENGILIADEVGMGKTRIACSVANAVIAAGGRVAVLVPPGLGYQWRAELKTAGVIAPPILRSLLQYMKAWKDPAATRPWFDDSCLVISHAFTNWRLGTNSEPWRWALLPEVYAHWVRALDGEFPENYRRKQRLGDPWVKRAAEGIVSAIHAVGARGDAWWYAAELARNTPWPGAMDASTYQRGADLRHWLERAVGLGLGVFDLVVVDEAHKSRGEQSGLSRLLDGVVLQPRKNLRRRLAMTATPVELDMGQWQQMLSRIDVKRDVVQDAISGYADAVREVRLTPRETQSRQNFVHAAQAFQSALSPYLIRRDKREEDAVRTFVERSGEGHHAYRELTEVLIKPMSLTPAWKHSICAAEALSFVARQGDDSTAKRLRLTLGNGHGISALIDELQVTPTDKDENATDTNMHDEEAPGTAHGKKRLERVTWWRQVMASPFSGAEDGEAALYEHPSILCAVERLEQVVVDGEKALVFGRFTRPMRALVRLLNARKMLRVLDSGEGFWPQERVHGDEWIAVRAAHRQLSRTGEADRGVIDDELQRQYLKLEERRKGFRDSLLVALERGLANVDQDARLAAIFGAFKETVINSPTGQATLSTIARALSDHLGDTRSNVTDEDLAAAFSDLILAAGDRDIDDDDAKDQQGMGVASLWESIEERVREEYSHIQGGYARLMHGETKPATRRLLQLAFNRKHSFPNVLVAQSVVGREGLNLHKACRTVLLLHPEWNPGVVEQQIGRVDRLGSLWEQMLARAILDGAKAKDLPRIRIWPVVFEGTYDEINWRTLKERWDELRAQLHGVVLTDRGGSDDEEMLSWIKAINEAAPNFSPSYVA